VASAEALDERWSRRPTGELVIQRVMRFCWERSAQNMQEGMKLAFAHFLRELFTAIARAGAAGPLEPEPLELPDPASFRRLDFEPNGTMRIHDSPLRARFEQLYRDLEGLDGTRIRECADCELFWAQRKDRVGCSKPCANRLRFSRYYGIHKKSGIRSHRMQDAAITARLRTRNIPKL
jgi:hypothetical protein